MLQQQGIVNLLPRCRLSHMRLYLYNTPDVEAKPSPINPFSINTSHHHIVIPSLLLPPIAIKPEPNPQPYGVHDNTTRYRKRARLLAHRIDQCARKEDNRSVQQFPGRWQHAEPCARWCSAAAGASSVRSTSDGSGRHSI